MYSSHCPKYEFREINKGNFLHFDSENHKHHHCKLQVVNNDCSSQKGRLLEKAGYSSCKQKIYNLKNLVGGNVTDNPVPKRNNKSESVSGYSLN